MAAARELEARRSHADQHRHRLARSACSDHRRHGAARRVLRGCTAQLKAATKPARHRDESHQRSRGSGTLLATAAADLVSMARPLLADPELPNKAAAGREDEINTCIACNQACLDRIFEGKNAHVPREPARRARNRAGADRPYRDTRVKSRRRRRPRGAGVRRGAAERGHSRDACSNRKRRSADSSATRAKCRARKSSTTRCATSACSSQRSGCDVRLGTRAAAAETRGGRLRRRRHGQRRAPARSRDSRHRASEGHHLSRLC